MEVDADDGRIYLPKRLREKYCDRFELVDRGDRIVLIPIDADPLAGPVGKSVAPSSPSTS